QVPAAGQVEMATEEALDRRVAAREGRVIAARLAAAVRGDDRRAVELGADEELVVVDAKAQGEGAVQLGPDGRTVDRRLQRPVLDAHLGAVLDHPARAAEHEAREHALLLVARVLVALAARDEEREAAGQGHGGLGPAEEADVAREPDVAYCSRIWWREAHRAVGERRPRAALRQSDRD